MPNNSLITIVIPVYNAAQYLSRCLDSIVGQTLTQIAIIAIDDGSTDNSLAILNAYAEKDARMQVISHPNHGVAYTRQRGLELVNTPYLMWCDADDWYASTMCEEMLAAIQVDEVDLAKCNIAPIDEAANLNRTDAKAYYKIPFAGCCKITAANKLNINVSLPSSIFKMSIIRQYEICFPESLKAHEDDAFMFMYLAVARKIKCIDRELYYYWRRADSLTPSFSVEGLKNFERTLLMRPVYEFLSQHHLWEIEKRIFYKKYFYLFRVSWSMASTAQKLELVQHEANWLKSFFDSKDSKIPLKHRKLISAILSADETSISNLLPQSRRKLKFMRWLWGGVTIGQVYEFRDKTKYKIFGITFYSKSKKGRSND